jgi:hypothetical protein
VADTVKSTFADVGVVKYVTSPKFNLYATATDEAGGSGLDTFKVEMMDKVSGGTEWVSGTGRTGTLVSNGEFTATASETYDLTPYTAMKFKITVWDKAGNATESIADLTKNEDSGQFEVRLDDTPPTASATLDNCLKDDVLQKIYISTGTTMTLTVTDTDPNSRIPSGVAKFAFKQSTAPVPTASDPAWISYSSDSATNNTAAAGSLVSLITKNGSSPVTLYAMDKAGNITGGVSLEGGYEFMLDDVKPTVTIISPVPSVIGWDGSYYVGKTPQASFSAVDEGSAASGVNKYHYSPSASEDATTVNKGDLYSSYTKPGTVSGFEAGTAHRIYVHVSDRAGNVQSEPIIDHEAKLDATNPEISSVNAWNITKNKIKTVDDDGRTDVKIAYPANAEIGSGVQKIRFAGNVASSAAISVKLNGTDPIALASTDGVKFEPDTNTITVTFASPVKLDGAGFFYVYNLELTGTKPAYTAVLIDATGNESEAASDAIMVDTTKPESVTFVPSDDDSMTVTDFSSANAQATGTFTEKESGLETIAISGISGFTTPTVTCGSTIYKVGDATNKLIVDGSGSDWSLTLSPPYKGGHVLYTITGITLGDPDGEKTLKARFTNTAELSADVASVSITRDTAKPTIKLQPTSSNVFPMSATEAGHSTTYYVRGIDTISFDWTGTDDGGSGILGYVKNSTQMGNTSGYETINLSEKDGKNVSLFSRDKVGNSSDAATVSVIQDTEPPTFSLTLKSGTVVTTGPLEVTKDTPADFSVSVYSKTVPVVYTINVSDSKSGPQSYTLGQVPSSKSPDDISLGEGVGYIFFATDKVNNESHKLSLSVIHDEAGPIVHVTPSGTKVFPTKQDVETYYTTDDQVTFTISSDDLAGITLPTVTPSCTVTGTATGTLASFTVDIPSDEKTYSIRCEDKLGNPTTKTVTVMKDKDPPTMTVTSPSSVLPASFSVTSGSKTFYTSEAGVSTIDFMLNATDPALTSYKIDSDVTTTTATKITNVPVTVTANGPSRVITVFDYFGHSSTCTVNLVKDTTPPSTLTVNPPASGVFPLTATAKDSTGTYASTGDSISFTVEAVDGESNIASYYAVSDGGDTVSATETKSPFTLSLAAGKTWTVYAKNNAELTSSTTVKVVKDTEPPSAISLVANGTSGQGWYKTFDSPLSYDVNAAMFFTLKATDARGVTCEINDADASMGQFSTSGSDYTWANVKIPAKNATFKITIKDGLGNSTTREIKVMPDTTPPSWNLNGWSCWGQSSLSMSGVSSFVTTSSDVTVARYRLNNTDSWTTLTGYNDNINGLSLSTLYVMEVSDRVGNAATLLFGGVPSNQNNKMIILSPQTSWTYSGSTVKIPLIATGCNSLTATNFSYSANSGTISSVTGEGSYTLSLSLDGLGTIDIPYMIKSGVVSAKSVFGNGVIASRISGETLTYAIRKESFNRARSSSKTNLPVWFTDVGKVEQSDQKRSADRDRASSDAASTAAGSTATASRTQSIEALHAAALSGMRAAANSGFKGDGSDILTEKVKVTAQGDIPGVAVMTAPEGSPAFVAYARGVAALRDRSGGMQAVKVDRSLFMITKEAKPEGFWERLLAFFGVREKGGRGESLVGFAAN